MNVDSVPSTLGNTSGTRNITISHPVQREKRCHPLYANFPDASHQRKNREKTACKLPKRIQPQILRLKQALYNQFHNTGPTRSHTDTFLFTLLRYFRYRLQFQGLNFGYNLRL